MQIEAGKCYVRRDGSVSGVIAKIDSEDYPFHDKEIIATYTPKGIRGLGPDHWSDLVAEYVEPVSPSEVSGKDSTVASEYDLSGIPAGYEFVGYRLVKAGEQYLSNYGEAKVYVGNDVDVAFKKKRVIVKPITPPEPVQRTAVLHRWLVWDKAGEEKVMFGTSDWMRKLAFKNVVDLGLYEEVKVNV
jgi:hypothetical protein